jgi:hypothetical protein
MLWLKAIVYTLAAVGASLATYGLGALIYVIVVKGFT